MPLQQLLAGLRVVAGLLVASKRRRLAASPQRCLCPSPAPDDAAAEERQEDDSPHGANARAHRSVWAAAAGAPFAGGGGEGVIGGESVVVRLGC